MDTLILGYKIDEGLLPLVSRKPDTLIDAATARRARSASHTYADRLSAVPDAQRARLVRNTKDRQMRDVADGVFDFDIRIANYAPTELIVFVRSHDDWLRFVDVCCRTSLIDRETGVGVTAGRFEAP